MSRNVSLPNSLPFSLERRKTIVTLKVRFVPTKDNYIKMPGQKFALSSPHSFFQKTLCVRKSLEFSFFPTFVCFYNFLRTFQIIFFAYLTREWFFLLFTYEILRGKIGERPAKVDPLAHALCLTIELL